MRVGGKKGFPFNATSTSHPSGMMYRFCSRAEKACTYPHTKKISSVSALVHSLYKLILYKLIYVKDSH